MTRHPDDRHHEIVPVPMEKQVSRELEFHIEMRTRELVARGVAPDAARAQARAAFGDLSRVAGELTRIGRATEGARERTRIVAETIQDVRFALRIFARRRAFAALTVVVLALGIGATTAIFSVADGVLLRPLPFARPDRLAAVWLTQPSLASDPVLAGYAEGMPIGTQEYQAIRASTTVFQDIGLFGTGNATLMTDAGAEQVTLVAITGSILRVLQVRPVIGRAFEGEDALGGPAVVLLGWDAWQRRYGGDTSVIGRRVMLGNAAHTVIGVLPPGLRLDRTNDPPSFWVPALRDSSDLPERRNRNYLALARLAPDASFEVATQQVARAVREVTGDTSLAARVARWQRDEGRTAIGPLVILFAAGGFLLLIACTNVAILQLGELGARSRELAARAALGAGIGRLVRQMLGESLVLAAGASVLGAALSWAMLRALLAIAPRRLPGMDTVHIDGRVLAFSLVCAALTGVLFGIVPAIVASRGDASILIRSGTGLSAAGAGRLQQSLIATQLSLSMVLLVVGLLFARSLDNLAGVEPGFRRDSLTAIRLSIPYRTEGPRVLSIVGELTRRLEATPGVSRVTVTSNAPFVNGTSSSPVTLEPELAGNQRPRHTMQTYVRDGYFETMGIRVLAGRGFQPTDGVGSELVAIVNESEVARDFRGTSPIGQRIRHQGQWRRVIGVVADVKSKTLGSDDGAGIYVPFAQHPTTGPVFLVRGAPGAVTPAGVKRMLSEVDPRTGIQRFASVPDLVARSYDTERYRTILVSVFGAMAALLAAIGLYGVSLRAATRRTREIGIRLALGGTGGGVAALLVSDAMRGVLAGIAIGIPAALIASHSLRKYLFGISPEDPSTLLAVALLLAATTLLASVLPARRASRVSPSAVLRSD